MFQSQSVLDGPFGTHGSYEWPVGCRQRQYCTMLPDNTTAAVPLPLSTEDLPEQMVRVVSPQTANNDTTGIS